MRTRLIDRQRQGLEVGIIRVGDAKPNEKQPGRPRSTFRITSANRALLETAQEVYGGELIPSQISPGLWELLTERAQLKALFSAEPKGDEGDTKSLELRWEQWQNRTTCLRSCNGSSCDTWDEKGNRITVPCMCTEGNEVCQLRAKLRVILSELPCIGNWRLNTGSEIFFAEAEDFIDKVRQLGMDVVPVVLTLTMREKATAPGAAGNKFPVVSITIDPDPVNMFAMLQGIQNKALGMNGAPALEEQTAPQVSTLPQDGAEQQLKLDAAHAFLAEIGLGDNDVRDFRGWCQGENRPWVTAALRARDEGVTTKAGLYDLLKDGVKA